MPCCAPHAGAMLEEAALHSSRPWSPRVHTVPHAHYVQCGTCTSYFTPGTWHKSGRKASVVVRVHGRWVAGTTSTSGHTNTESRASARK